MRLKRGDYPKLKIDEKEYKLKHFSNEDFSGNVALLKVNKMTTPLKTTSDFGELTILDKDYKWLEFYPDYDKDVCLTACIDDKGFIFEYYFDIANDNGITDDGIPYIDDLYLDVVMYHNGRMKMVDQDELQEGLDKAIISEKEFHKAYRVAERVMKQVENRQNDLLEFCNKYLRLIEE